MREKSLSNEEITLTLEKREVLGKQVRGLRREGKIPAVIHDHGKPSIHVMAPTGVMVKAYTQAGKHHPVSLTVGKQQFMALIKSVDFEPRKQTVRHVVFNAIKADEKQRTEVPVHFMEGEIPAEKAGFMVIRTLDAVEIEALPKDLIDVLEVDASGLAEIGDKITVADIKAPATVEIITEPEHSIAVVEETKAQISEEAEEAEGEAGGETSEGETPAAEGDAEKPAAEETKE